ncbi:MAG: hypothetical protein LUE13_04840 [Akkermansiaceae bacterium]|nr:hypothetical protein [Akkermansiaceae bacterium]
MKVFPLFPFLFSVALTGTLAGCGGGSGRSGDDGQFSLSGRTAVLLNGRTALFSLQFAGRDVDITRIGNRFAYKGVYTYMVRPDHNSAVLDIKAGADGDTYCTMSEVSIVFDDTECDSGSIVSGTCQEFGPHLEPEVQGEPQSMGGWSFNLSQN